MKKSISLTVLLFFIFVVLFIFNVYFWRNVSSYIQTISILKEFNDDTYKTIIENYQQGLTKISIYGSLSILCLLADLAAMVLIAIKDFPVFKPLAEKLQAKLQARRQINVQAKADRAEANKQARIEQLQAELDELKKD